MLQLELHELYTLKSILSISQKFYQSVKSITNIQTTVDDDKKYMVVLTVIIFSAWTIGTYMYVSINIHSQLSSQTYHNIDKTINNTLNISITINYHSPIHFFPIIFPHHSLSISPPFSIFFISSSLNPLSNISISSLSIYLKDPRSKSICSSILNESIS